MDISQKELYDQKYLEGNISDADVKLAIDVTPFTVDSVKIDDLFRKLDLEGTLLLDVGCGGIPQCFLHAPDSNCRIIGLDFSMFGLKTAQKLTYTLKYHGTFEPVVGDAVALPFPDATFDAIACAMVIEHIENPLRAIKEMGRVLKPGGKLWLVTVHKKYPLRKIYKLFLHPSYDEFYGHKDDLLIDMDELKSWSADAGLNIEEELYFYFFESVIWDVFIVPKLVKAGVARSVFLSRWMHCMKWLIKHFAIIDYILRKYHLSCDIAIVARKKE